jgi:hypothetical protein
MEEIAARHKSLYQLNISDCLASNLRRILPLHLRDICDVIQDKR